MTRIGSLFSGGGGLDLAALELFPGSSMAWHAEIEPAASRVLAHRWPGVPNLGSVTEIDWRAIEPVDVLTGGFPCQDVSAAGLRRGMAEGTRSGLWSHMAEAIDMLRPRFVLIENVKGLLSAPAIREVEYDPPGLGDVGTRPVLRALGAVLGDLADLGFDAEWTSLRASAVGACHRRERVFILAYPADTEGGGWESVDDGTGGEARGGRKRVARRGARHGAGPVILLPTPQVADVTGGHKTRSGVRSNELLLPGVAEAYATGALLPTPNASDATGGGQHPGKRVGHSQQLIDYALAHGTPQWGKYEAAILRQEQVSRSAPCPTELGARGNPRLSAAFAEWMMMWPAGWVTDPGIGLSRNDQLRIIGNGVVTAQAVHAFRQLRLTAVAA